MMREIWIVLHKELTDSFRDRRTWIYSILLPIALVPVLVIVSTMGVANQLAAAKTPLVPLAVVGAENAPALVKHLELGDAFRIVPVADGRAALTAKVARVSLILPPGFEQQLGSAGVGQVQLLYNSTDPKAEAVKERLLGAVQAYSQAVVAKRLTERGLDPAILRPVDVAIESTAPPQRRDLGMLAMMLPMFLSLWGAVGGMHVAIDLTVGEKERGTLESLLTLPVSRLSLVIGKYLTALLAAISAQLVALMGFLIGFQLKVMLVDNRPVTGIGLPWTAIAGIVGVSAVLAALFAAVELAIGIGARSVREAQSFQAPLSFAAMIPWLFMQYTGPADTPRALFYLPVFNNSILYKELVLGIAAPQHLLVTLLTCTLAAYLALRWAASRFQQESALLRS